MPTPQRLPFVNGDDGQWGDILVQWLKKEHYDDGTDNADNGGHQNVTLRAGTTSAGTAPLKFTSGSLLSSPEAGAVEFLTDKLYFTSTTGPTRKTIATYDDSSGATGDIYYRNSGGNFTRLGVGSDGDVLTLSSGLPSWDAPSSGGDASTNTSTSVDGEVALFSGTGGKTLKRATGSGLAKLTSGVLSTATSGTDYAPATSGTDLLKGNGSGGFSAAVANTDYAPINAPAFTGQTTFTDGTATHGQINIGVGTFFGLGLQGVSLFGNTADTQPITQLLGITGGGGSLGFGPGGSTAADVVISRSGTGTASVTGVFNFSSAPMISAISNTGTLTLPTSTDTLVGRATTDTLTNKRITRRSIATATPGGTPTINSDTTDIAEFTSLNTAITSMTTNLSGTPSRGDTLQIAFTDNGSARAITWGTKFEASTVALPTTTVTSTRLDTFFVWNTVTSKWRLMWKA